MHQDDEEVQTRGTRIESDNERPLVAEHVAPLLNKMVNFWTTVIAPIIRETFRAIRVFLPNMKTIPDAYLKQMKEIEETYSRYLDSLADLDDETRSRIRPIVISAAYSSSLRTGWQRAINSIILRYDDALMMISFLTFAAFVWANHSTFATPRSLACWIGIAISSYIFQKFLGLIWKTAERYGPIAYAILRTIALAGVFDLRDELTFRQSSIAHWTPSRTVLRWTHLQDHQIAEIHINVCLIDACTVATFILIPMILTAFLNVVIEYLTPVELERDLACARLVCWLLIIASTLQEAINLGPISVVTAGESGGLNYYLPIKYSTRTSFYRKMSSPIEAELPLFRAYITEPKRDWLVKDLEQLARFVEGRWRRALQCKDKSANRAVDEMTAGVAQAIRRWKPTVALGGDQLDKARKAFTVALLNSLEGDWHLLASDTPALRVTIGQRVTQWLRRMAALAILLAAAYLLLTPPTAWKPELGPFDAALPLASTLAALALDPSLPDRFGRASKVTAMLPGAKG